MKEDKFASGMTAFLSPYSPSSDGSLLHLAGMNPNPLFKLV